MLLLLIFAFIGGIVTILSPCILPILPVVLSGSLAGGKKRPIGVVTGFIFSFTFFTLFLTSIVNLLNIPAESLRTLSIIVIFVFGLSLIIPEFQQWTERIFTNLGKLTPKKTSDGFWGGILVGLSIGLVWTPCVGPILASVISLALTGTVTGSAFLITLAYALGTAIPMLAIVWGGRELLNRFPWLLQNSQMIQKVFGILMILTAVAIYFQYDRKFQSYILQKFPAYGQGLTSLEDNAFVRDELYELRQTDLRDEDLGKPMFDITSDGPQAPELISDGQWFNLPEGENELVLSELEKENKVVLIDFWTYTCINCIRTLPYLRNWHDKYYDDGLVIIGVHTPEFEFEKDADNVAEAIEDFGLEYPVMQDNDYLTWRNYNNRYWPAKYLIDKNGVIRYTHFGEGEYDETEKQIRNLLEASGSDVFLDPINNPDYDINTRTPELYLGYGRIQYLVNRNEIVRNKVSEYRVPTVIPDNSFAYGGEWTVGEEYANPQEGAELILNFEAEEVFLVMRTLEDSVDGEVEVYLDGELVEKFAGVDVVDGIVVVTNDRLYKLIKLDKREKKELLLRFLDDNIQIFAFTFG